MEGIAMRSQAFFHLLPDVFSAETNVWEVSSAWLACSGRELYLMVTCVAP